jgi:hypothetical protein
MANFISTINPTPFGYFDSDSEFQQAADPMVLFVKRRLGDDILSVELTKKQIWANFEEACLEYARLIQELKIKSELVHVLGRPTGTTDYTNKYPQLTLEYLLRLAEPYATLASVGGSYNAKLGYFTLVDGRQDYDIYSELKLDDDPSKTVYESLPSGSKGKMRIVEVFHFEPLAAQQMLLNASNITNFLATNFNYESYVNSTVFYVLPVFEDVLRRGMLEEAFRVRRSNYSWSIIGTKLRIYPIPGGYNNPIRLYVKIMPRVDPLNPSFDPTNPDGGDASIGGVSGPHNVPFQIIPFSSITAPGRQWIRQYTLAISTEQLGRIRSKFQTIPIPNADLTLNGTALITEGREDKAKLHDQLREFLDGLSTDKLAEQQANIAEQLNKQLRFIPMPLGKSISIR